MTATSHRQPRHRPVRRFFSSTGQVLDVQLPWLDEVIITQTPRKLPVVLTPTEVRELLQQLSGIQGLVATLLAPLSVPRSLLEVNEVLASALSTDSTLDNPYQVLWSATVDGIRVVTHGEAGACSTIPAYVEYFGTFTVHVVVSSPTRPNPVLDLAIADPDGVLIHTRCWTTGDKGRLQRHDQDNGTRPKAMADRTQALSDALSNWVAKNRAELLDDVADNLALRKDANGKFVFDGASRTWASDAANEPHLVWMFKADPALQALKP